MTTSTRLSTSKYVNAGANINCKLELKTPTRPQTLRMFALIVSAHPYCAHNSLGDVMPRHALSARAVEEMWR